MEKRPLGRSGLQIAPLVLGGNVFGWTADREHSFRVLDAFVDAGFDAIDTADVYSRWAPGHEGGESETVIGEWLRNDPGKRDKVTIFTKVGSDLGENRKGLSPRWIAEAAENSLRRLGTDRIDLYFSHWPDKEVPYEDTLGAFAKLKEAGKIGALGASNLDAGQLSAALDAASAKGLPRYEVLQPEYNLYDRASFEGSLQDLCVAADIGVVTYFSLASGFLTGKYRSEADLGKSQRGGGIKKYLDARGMRVLSALDAVAGRHGAEPAAVALAWLMRAPGVTAPIASATRGSQVESFAKAAALPLTEADIRELDAAGAV